MTSESHLEPDWVDECDDPGCVHDDDCLFCYEPLQHCDCEDDTW